MLSAITIYCGKAYACGTWKELKDCETAKDAFDIVNAKSPYLFNSHHNKERLFLFDYDKKRTQIKNLKLIDTNRKDYLYFTFTLVADNPTYKYGQPEDRFNFSKMQVKVHYFRSIKYPGPRPLVIGFPTVLNLDVAEPLFAKFMAKKGISVMIPDVESIVDPTVPLSEIDNIMRRTIIKGRIIIDIAEDFLKREIDSTKIGTWGLSLGGVRAATLIGVDERVKAAAIISAGGNNADIFTHSQQSYVVDFRKAKQKIPEQDTDEKYFNYIRNSSNVDPLYYAHNVDPENIFMVMSHNDSLIPTRNQLELWDAFGRPGPEGKNWKKGKHKAPIVQYLLVPWLKHRLLNFYHDRFHGIK